MSLLEIGDLRKRYGGVVALDGAGFTVDAPGIVGFIGPNGAGKTTLFDIVCGRQSPDSGTLRFEGRRLNGLPPHRLARLGFARSFQECRTLNEATCLDNLLFAAQDKRLAREMLGCVMRRRPPREEARALLASAGLECLSATLAGDLSFGQRRLVEILCTLMARPRVLLLDEPASGVNPTLLATLTAILREAVPRLGLLLLVIEHNMEFVMNLAARIVVLHRGKILADGTPAEIRSDARVIDAYLG